MKNDHLTYALIMILLLLAMGFAGNGDYELALEQQNASLQLAVENCKLAQAAQPEPR